MNADRPVIPKFCDAKLWRSSWVLGTWDGESGVEPVAEGNDKRGGEQASQDVNRIVVAAIDGRETQEDRHGEVVIANGTQVAEGEKNGTQRHGDMAAREGCAGRFEDSINKAHELK